MSHLMQTQLGQRKVENGMERTRLNGKRQERVRQPSVTSYPSPSNATIVLSNRAVQLELQLPQQSLKLRISQYMGSEFGVFARVLLVLSDQLGRGGPRRETGERRAVWYGANGRRGERRRRRGDRNLSGSNGGSGRMRRRAPGDRRQRWRLRMRRGRMLLGSGWPGEGASVLTGCCGRGIRFMQRSVGDGLLLLQGSC